MYIIEGIWEYWQVKQTNNVAERGSLEPEVSGSEQMETPE